MMRFIQVMFTVFCSCVIIACAVFTVFTAGPSIESHFWPVDSDFKLTSLKPSDDGLSSIVTFQWHKNRDCEFVGTAWYLGTRDTSFTRVQIYRVHTPEADAIPHDPSRPIGTQSGGPWIIPIPPKDLQHDSFAVVTHRCHLLWVTTTDLFP